MIFPSTARRDKKTEPINPSIFINIYSLNLKSNGLTLLENRYFYDCNMCICPCKTG